jgi:phage tail-like protein
MATGVRNDPYRGFNFRIEIDGVTIAAFSDVTGLTAEGDAVAYREGDEKFNSVRQLMGLRKYTNITMKRGFTQNGELWDWYAAIAGGRPLRRSGTIVLQDEAHQDVLRFEFRNGWINKIEGPHMNASGNEVAIESIEIVHEGLEIKVA